MIEIDLVNNLSAVANVYCGSIPQKCTLPAIVYQVITRDDAQNTESFSGLTLTHFRLEIHASSYLQAKLLTKQIKAQLSIPWEWIFEGEWDVFTPSIDGTDNVFDRICLNAGIYSDEWASESTNGFNNGFSSGFGNEISGMMEYITVDI